MSTESKLCEKKCTDSMPVGPFAITREKAAHAFLKMSPMIRRRIRGKLRKSGRILAEEDDILASAWRRVDAAVANGELRATSEKEFWSFVHRTTENLLCNRTRDERRRPIARSALRPDQGEFDGAVESLPELATSAVLRDIFAGLPTDADRELLLWRLSGVSYAVIAAATGRTEQALRTAWAKMCRGVRQQHAHKSPADESP